MGESTGKSQDYAETWEGGFIRHDSRGRKVYVIRRVINGRNFKVSTRATTLRASMEQLKRFETDPEHYSAPHWRDGMNVQAGTGWHVSELVRFTKTGSVELYRGEAEGITGVLVCPQTKSGEPLRTAVSAEVLEARKRLLERGSFSFEKYGLAIKGACNAAGISPFTPGRFRHSVATCAIEKRGSGIGGSIPQPQEPDHHAALLRDARRSGEDSHPGVGHQQQWFPNASLSYQMRWVLLKHTRLLSGVRPHRLPNYLIRPPTD